MKKRINAVIPENLYIKVTESEYGLTEAIIKGLEMLLTPPKADNIQVSQDILDLQARITELQEQIKIKDYQIEIKDNDGSLHDRIEDLKAQIQALYDQLHIKDDQIEKLNENMNKQAFHIQTLLTQKAIEAPGAKRWFEFWK